MKIIKQTLALLCLTTFTNLPNAHSIEPSGKQDIEVGLVSWNRDFNAALKKSKNMNKPILALFQEVPGCHGCKTFGKEVLSNKKLVKKIENNFIPVLIYNNRRGKDSELLAQYNEPSWNYQVIRFLDSNGKDIIPRRDKIWSLDKTNSRVDEAIKAFAANNKNVVSKNESTTGIKEVAFAQHCFWTGEMKLGGIDGVKQTEAGFYNGREVTRVWYDENMINKESLISKAKQSGVADKVYTVTDNKVFNADYRKAPASDQKRQLRGTKYENLELNPYQATKVNAFARKDQAKANSFLQ